MEDRKALHEAKEQERGRGERDITETRGDGVKETCLISMWAHFPVNFAGIPTRIPQNVVAWLAISPCRLPDGVQNGPILHCFEKIGQSVSNPAASTLCAGLNTTHCLFFLSLSLFPPLCDKIGHKSMKEAQGTQEWRKRNKWQGTKDAWSFIVQTGVDGGRWR